MSLKQNLANAVLGDIQPQSTIGTSNQAVRENWLKSQLESIPSGHRILDAGAGTTRYRKYCEHLKYVSQDFGQYDGQGDGEGLQTGSFDQSLLDIVCDIVDIPEETDSFDAVMCIEVLEHVPAPVDALKELARLLKPGGTLIVTAPFCSITHYAPYFFQTGYSRYFYEHWLGEFGFEIEEITPNGTYYEWLAQEIRRLPSLSKQIEGHGGIGHKRRRAMAEIIDWLAEMEGKSPNPSELLALGLHVRAVKK